MGRSPRIRFPGAFYHIFNRGVAKMEIVTDDRDRRTFMALVGESVKKHGVLLFSYCLMNNHFHLFLQTPIPNLDKFMADFLRPYVIYFNRRQDRVGPLFQSRYQDRLVQTDLYGQTLLRYIHRNPVEAGIVKDPGDYAWSSYPCFIGKFPKWDWLEIEWPLRLFGENTNDALNSFREFHSQKTPESEIKLFSSSRGPYLGEAEYFLPYLSQS